ncbi:MAG: hypothetical protein NT165_03930 [Candidatus Falkowbacteria bacterium]|nr:hypothetical protein [Candidatus Falkowbacteria bacterium]
MSIEESPRLGKNEVEKNEEQIQEKCENISGEAGAVKREENENVVLNNTLRELSEEDAKLVSEEFMILNGAEIPRLKSKISSFRLIDKASDEIKDLYKSDRMPAHMRDSFGGQEQLDKLVDDLSLKLRYSEELKKFLLKKDVESIKSFRERRVKEMDEEFGAYSLTGKEYQRKEDSYNRKLEEENELKKIRDDINWLPNLN